MRLVRGDAEEEDGDAVLGDATLDDLRVGDDARWVVLFAILLPFSMVDGCCSAGGCVAAVLRLLLLRWRRGGASSSSPPSTALGFACTTTCLCCGTPCCCKMHVVLSAHWRACAGTRRCVVLPSGRAGMSGWGRLAACRTPRVSAMHRGIAHL